MKAILLLEDGTEFIGTSFGETGEVFGEIVFNTAMTGYQEIVTDPSYHGQLVTMTYPLIGNYGITQEDIESSSPKATGFIVKELSNGYSNWRGTESLPSYLKKNNVVGIEGVDTRSIVLRIREKGAMKAVISTSRFDVKSLKKDLDSFPGIEERDLVNEVSCEKSIVWKESSSLEYDISTPLNKAKVLPYKIAVYDFGIKYNILRILKNYFEQVEVFPFNTPASDILASNADGVFLSNGPGDPMRVTSGIDAVRELIGKLPVFGICLGHQIMGLASGAKTYKLKFGHHGANHPVKDLKTGVIEITSQNHNFAIDENSLKDLPVKITHINLNDNTVEGIELCNAHAFSIQYHPESAPGPHDSRYLFELFQEMVKESKGA
ncbi:MAG: glutamine-hydrolyzing carbamoyl-phosphate synthase small subunit [Candidatus Aureabacteria bacterium]|nr:glutamine-hydrolyzing carbamoyl-phosphate synthase small subunit [Candidatus Auribacterota bacterium]